MEPPPLGAWRCHSTEACASGVGPSKFPLQKLPSFCVETRAGNANALYAFGVVMLAASLKSTIDAMRKSAPALPAQEVRCSFLSKNEFS